MSSSDDEKKCCCGEHGDESKCECGCEHGGQSNSDSDAEREAPEFDMDAMGDVPLPKPTLTTFATTLAQQAMVSMGVLPNPITGKTTFLLNQASYFIDTLVMIIEKTEGNRTENETTMLENVVHELRMLYVAAANEKKRRDDEKKES
ncbi:MAG: DUF1844 domain-containing protein [Thermoguttaceae bacterium]|nr:DUF1844 domain-containing protein [Thermoguttaceae bacterium]